MDKGNSFSRIWFLIYLVLFASCSGTKLEKVGKDEKAGIEPRSLGNDLSVPDSTAENRIKRSFPDYFDYFGLDELVRDKGMSPINMEEVYGVQDMSDLHRIKKFAGHLEDFSRKLSLGKECPGPSADGVKRFYCPSLTAEEDLVCIEDYKLCNGHRDCANAEDENPMFCFFHRAMMAKIAGVERHIQHLVREIYSQN